MGLRAGSTAEGWGFGNDAMLESQTRVSGISSGQRLCVGLGFRDWALGFRLLGLGFMIDLGFRFQGCGSSVSGFPRRQRVGAERRVPGTSDVQFALG